MRVELTHHLADDAGALDVFLVVVEPQLAHAEEDAPVHGLEPVADVGQRARHDHAHGVIEIGALHLVGDGDGPDIASALVAGRAAAREVLSSATCVAYVLRLKQGGSRVRASGREQPRIRPCISLGGALIAQGFGQGNPGAARRGKCRRNTRLFQILMCYSPNADLPCLKGAVPGS